MRWLLAVMTSVAVPLAGASAERAADPCLPLALTLRWTSTDLSMASAAAVQRETSRIWRALGVDLQWQPPGAAGMIAVTVLDGHPCGTAAPAGPILGCVDFRDGEPSGELRVSASAALDAAAIARYGGRSLGDRPPQLIRTVAIRLLGRAAAHELGHYLLAARTHADRGLMRATFDPSEALRPYVDGYGLSGSELARLRQRLAGPR